MNGAVVFLYLLFLLASSTGDNNAACKGEFCGLAENLNDALSDLPAYDSRDDGGIRII
jgi:hypothetical protein